jgi:hypothetical protein
VQTDNQVGLAEAGAALACADAAVRFWAVQCTLYMVWTRWAASVQVTSRAVFVKYTTWTCHVWQRT